MGVKDVGEVGAKNLASHFKNLNNLVNAKYEDLIQIRDVGDSIAKNIIDFFSNETNLTIIKRLIESGLVFETEEKEYISKKLENLTFVYSGTFTISRDELKQKIEENGGKVVSGLSKTLSYLIVGENMGPAKRDKALKDNIKMISEQEFYNLLNK